MSYCTGCGGQLTASQSYCTSCGTPVPPAPAVVTRPAEPSPNSPEAATVAFGFQSQATPAGSESPAGWYSDGTPGQTRYWDGFAWTDQVAPAASTAQQVRRPGRGRWPIVVLTFGVLAVAAVAVVIAVRGGKVSARPAATATPPAATSPATTAPPPTSVTPSATATPTRSVVGSVDISAVAGAPAAAGVATSFAAYFEGINARDFATAFAVLSPVYRSRGGGLTVDRWSAGLSTTQDTDVRLTRITATAAGATQATVSFTSRQAARDGYQQETCTRWLIDYTLSSNVASDPPYVIDTVKHRSILPC
jgi:Protein of unknown function (DUF2510)